MAVWALGINHTTAPLDLRGRFAIAAHDLPPTLAQLKATLGSQAETAIVSTCNRTELYCAGQGIEASQGLAWLAANGGVSLAELQSHAYIKQADQAARHVFRVAAGLDSMVLGEAQILGQLKDACALPKTRASWARRCINCFNAPFMSPKRCAAIPK